MMHASAQQRALMSGSACSRHPTVIKHRGGMRLGAGHRRPVTIQAFKQDSDGVMLPMDAYRVCLGLPFTSNSCCTPRLSPPCRNNNHAGPRGEQSSQSRDVHTGIRKAAGKCAGCGVQPGDAQCPEQMQHT